MAVAVEAPEILDTETVVPAPPVARVISNVPLFKSTFSEPPPSPFTNETTTGIVAPIPYTPSFDVEVTVPIVGAVVST